MWSPPLSDTTNKQERLCFNEAFMEAPTGFSEFGSARGLKSGKPVSATQVRAYNGVRSAGYGNGVSALGRCLISSRTQPVAVGLPQTRGGTFDETLCPAGRAAVRLARCGLRG